MATYEYRCRECEHTFERREPISEHRSGGHPECPSCGSRKTRQLMSPFFADTAKKG